MSLGLGSSGLVTSARSSWYQDSRALELEAECIQFILKRISTSTYHTVAEVPSLFGPGLLLRLGMCRLRSDL